MTSAPSFAEERPHRRVWEPTATVGPLTAVAAALAVGPLAASQGGFFSTSWGWAAVPFAWVAAIALLVRARIRLPHRELAFVSALVLLTAWTALSLAWSRDFPETMLEIERLLVYVAAGVAAVVVIRREFVPWAVAGMAAAAFGICAYALATRLFPTGVGGSTIEQNRLQGPIGYWNGLGIFAVMTALLLVALLARAAWTPARPLAAAALVIVLPTLYFTFSRGAWAALIVGIAVALSVDPRRLQLSVSLLVVTPFAAGAVALCAGSGVLTKLKGSLGTATSEGHRAALGIVLLALGAAGAVAALEWARLRVEPASSAHRAYAAVLGGAALAAVVAGLVHYGGPVTAVRRAYDSFTGAPVQVGAGGSLNSRLLNLSNNGRIDLWSAAWHDFHAHPLLGSGAGSFEVYWYEHRTDNQTVLDAHSLYLETMAEVGLPGLALLLVALLAPLVALSRIRASRFGPPIAAAYVAFLVHAAVDWDWELSAVTLTALLCAVLLLAIARDGRGVAIRMPVRAVVVAVLLVPLAGFSVYGLIGARRFSSASDALAAGDWKHAAADARSTIQWLPWSASAWHLLAAADSARGLRGRAIADMRQAVKLGPNEWANWYDLGNLARGAERRAAYARARALNPREGAIPKR